MFGAKPSSSLTLISFIYNNIYQSIYLSYLSIYLHICVYLYIYIPRKAFECPVMEPGSFKKIFKNWLKICIIPPAACAQPASLPCSILSSASRLCPTEPGATSSLRTPWPRPRAGCSPSGAGEGAGAASWGLPSRRTNGTTIIKYRAQGWKLRGGTDGGVYFKK